MDTTIGRYRIEKELGRGGMGVVYLAHDPVIDRVVALKTIRNAEGLAASVYAELRERFLREAKAAGRLQHPNIVAVLDAGTNHETGVSYIAMELVQGRDLESEITAGRRFSAAEAVELVAAVADGLDYAHENGVVHRDVKPANILLDDRGRVRITDFGIAHLAESGLTRTGQVLGSPAYMSPEQITGSELDRKSDIFSLGVVLYQLLTGERPFLGEGMSTLAYQIVHTEPIPARKLNPALTVAHDEVLRRALAKSPGERYGTARDMADDLRGGTRLSALPHAEARAIGSGTVVGAAPVPAANRTVVGAAPSAISATGTVMGAPSPAILEGSGPPRRITWLLPAAVTVMALVFALVIWLRPGEGPSNTAAHGVGLTSTVLSPVSDSEIAESDTPASGMSPVEPLSEASSAAIGGSARLFVDFDHHFMDGTVWLRFDDTEVWTSPLRAVKQSRVKVPFIKRGPEFKLAKEVIEKLIDVPAGAHRVSVTVISPQSGVDDTANVNLDVAPGATGYLRIRVGRSNRTIELKTTR